MSSKGLVSVVIIFLNAEQFLEEAINSVFGQSYTDWELLLVDDGSSDASTATALRYAARYGDRVRYLEHSGHQNQGMSASRNLGMRHARGPYIAMLDADDVWLPHKLERQVAIMQAYPQAGLVYGAAQYWYSWAVDTHTGRDDFVPRLGVRPNTLVAPPALMTALYPLGSEPAPVPSDLLFRTAVFATTAGFEESFRGPMMLYEDQAFLAKVYLNYAVFVAGETWTKYRQRPDSCVASTTGAGQYHIVRQRFLHWLAAYLAGQKNVDPQVWKAYRTAMAPYRHPRLHRLATAWRTTPRTMRWLARRLASRMLPVSFHRWLAEQRRSKAH